MNTVDIVVQIAMQQ